MLEKILNYQEGFTPRVLTIVSVRPTFCEGGALPAMGGNAIAEAVAAYVDTYRGEYQLVVTAQDWHTGPGPHFSEMSNFMDTWPPHDVTGVAEAELRPMFAHVNVNITIKKGQYKVAYSGSKGTARDGKALEQVLHDADVADVDVVGPVESHYAVCTAVGAARTDFRTRMLCEPTAPATKGLGTQVHQRMTPEHVEIV